MTTEMIASFNKEYDKLVDQKVEEYRAKLADLKSFVCYLCDEDMDEEASYSDLVITIRDNLYEAEVNNE